jgi:hypothetical protein
MGWVASSRDRFEVQGEGADWFGKSTSRKTVTARRRTRGRQPAAPGREERPHLRQRMVRPAGSTTPAIQQEPSSCCLACPIGS